VSRYFLYCRKSTQEDDRQVLSLESQVKELTALAERRGLHVHDCLIESRSAKMPGRPVFNAMMQRIERGEAQGIICWKLDRLARNPLDAGRIMWALKKYGLEIATPTQIFRPGDESTFLSYIEFGMAQKYIEDLGRNVKRGLRAKAEKGWYSSHALPGYLNNHHKNLGERDISMDPERFDLVRKMWDMLLSGSYSPRQIMAIANGQWGFRKRNGLPLTVTGIYRIFSHAFYCGLFEYPKGSGSWYRGKHQPMITQEEYDCAQVLLGRNGRPRPVRHSFSYTGLIRCGECSAMITAEEKHQLICPRCRLKFAYRNREACPGCRTLIEEMRHPIILRYTYYHCTKRKAQRCHQPVIRLEDLQAQIEGRLAQLDLSERSFRWAMGHLEEFRSQKEGERARIAAAQKKTYENSVKRIQNLIVLKTSAENADGSLLSDEEYAEQRSALMKEKAKLQGTIDKDPLSRAIEQVTSTLLFVRCLRDRVQQGRPHRTRTILASVGSNLTLNDKRLDVTMKFPFRLVEEALADTGANSTPFEPTNWPANEGETVALATASPVQLSERYDVRTYKRILRHLVKRLIDFFLTHPDYYVPTLKESEEEEPSEQAA
jgi:site-specific DNA recombinase